MPLHVLFRFFAVLEFRRHKIVSAGFGTGTGTDLAVWGCRTPKTGTVSGFNPMSPETVLPICPFASLVMPSV
jgi:hypothetical protein